MPPAAQAQRADDASTHERILEAALECFSEQGFDGATTREIARRAGVNLGLIQYYFEGKEALWRSAVSRAFAELVEGNAEALREAGGFDDRERMRRLVRRYVRWIGRHPEFVRMMHDEGRRESPRMRWLVDEHVRALHETTSAALRSGQEQGFVPSGIDPVHLHYILIGAMTLVFHQAPECRHLTGRDPSEEAFIEAHADAVTRLFLGPPGEEKTQ